MDEMMNVSGEDFSEIRFMPAFVDKSLFIKTLLLNENTRILLIAPRRFGKTANITMLKRFFEIPSDPKDVELNPKLFKGLEIEKCDSIMKTHFGKYPV